MADIDIQPVHDEILVETRGRLGIVTLNRPKALNALSLGMIRALDRALDHFAADPAIDAVAIRGAGEKAFCAGGDVRALVLTPAGPEKEQLARDFFAEEYRVNHKIHTYAKPFVALIDGVTMGGGVGLSVHGSHRVATERTLFAMPETALGLFPDVGATWFLNRCPGEMGIYLGLAGVRLKAADALALGLATHYVTTDRLEVLVAALAAQARLDHATVDRLLAAASADAGPNVVAGRQAGVDRAFAGESVEAIVRALEAEPAEWAQEALHTLRRASPTSLKTTLRQLRAGRGLDIKEMFRIEYRLAVRSVDGNDFPEGVRAILVDKDNKPNWRPSRLEAVDDAAIDRLFAPFDAPGAELSFG
jgi:enoyl-CoA hydratase